MWIFIFYLFERPGEHICSGIDVFTALWIYNFWRVWLLSMFVVALKLYVWVFCFLLCEDEEEAGLLELLKSQICDNAALYAQKYDEEFQRYLPRFVTAIWNLLVTTGQEVKYDLVRWWWRQVIKASPPSPMK